MSCFRNRSDICTKCNFKHFCKTNFFQRCFDFPKTDIVTKLSDNRRSQFGNNRSLLHCLNQLENLGFICNRSKWTCSHTLSAFYAFLVINPDTSALIAGNGFHTTCSCTWTNLLCNCIIRTDCLTFSTFNTFIFINMRFSVYNADSTFRANLYTRMCHTATALIGYFIYVILTHITSRRNYLHQRRLIIFFCHITLIQSTCNMNRFVIRS